MVRSNRNLRKSFGRKEEIDWDGDETRPDTVGRLVQRTEPPNRDQTERPVDVGQFWWSRRTPPDPNMTRTTYGHQDSIAMERLGTGSGPFALSKIVVKGMARGDSQLTLLLPLHESSSVWYGRYSKVRTVTT